MIIWLWLIIGGPLIALIIRKLVRVPYRPKLLYTPYARPGNDKFAAAQSIIHGLTISSCLRPMAHFETDYCQNMAGLEDGQASSGSQCA